jgi:putative transposase
LLAEKADELEVGIEGHAIKPNHLHMFVNAPPSIAVSQLDYRFKGYTALVLRHSAPPGRRRRKTFAEGR